WKTMQHSIFKHSSLTQDAKSRSVNNWLQRLYHGLSLDYGDVEVTEMSNDKRVYATRQCRQHGRPSMSTSK
ncbi:Uncharacterized protein FWK35_00029705, partial [Aphis craccivora]